MTAGEYQLVVPGSLREALDLMNGGDWRPFAGGTDLMVVMHAGRLPLRRFVSLWRLAELRGISDTSGALRIGAGVTFAELRRHPVVREEFPLLAAAAREIGSIANQNRATIGGNIANASPAADAPPALLVYDAELELMSATGTRTVPYDAFHTGYKEMNLAPGEVISAVVLPRRPVQWRQIYRKVGTRSAQAISKVCIAARLSPDGTQARVAMGSVAPVPTRCREAEEALVKGDGLEAALANDIRPIDDMRSSAAYRRQVALNLLRNFAAR